MNTDSWWLWIILVFLLIAFIIWLLGRKKRSKPETMAHPARESHSEGTSGEEQLVDERIPVQALPEPSLTQTDDNLEIIEGIGPKIAGLLRQAGISTFSALASADPARLDEILTAANLRRLANPGTWPKQAALAAEGRWDELKEYQNQLKGGKEA